MRSLPLRRLVAAIRPLSRPDGAEGGWQIRFRTHLIALAIACVLPLAGLGLYSMLRLAAAERAADQSQIIGTARAVATTIEQNFRHHLTILRALAKRLPGDGADLDDFYGDCAAHAAENDGWIFLADNSGQQIFNTRRPLGAALPMVAPTLEFAEVVATGEPVVSNLHTGMIEPQLQFTVYLPIVEDGSVRRVLGMVFAMRTLNALLRAQHLPEDWTVAAIDGNGTIVAHPDDMAPALGQKASPEILALPAGQSEAFLHLTTLRGVAVYMGAARSAPSGWMVVVGIPAAIVDAPLYQTLERFGVLGGALLALALGAAALIGGHLAKAMNRLANTARALARHEPMPVARSTVREVDQAARALADSGKALAESERRLRRSQQHLTLAQRVSQTGSVLHDLKSDVSEWSDELYRILGRERGAAPPTFQSFLEAVHEEDRAALVEANDLLLRGERRRSQEYRIIRPDGALRVIHSEVEPLLDEAGRPSRVVITFHDVTELRAAEGRERDLEHQLLQAQQHEAAELRESEARLRRSQQHLALAQRVSRTGSALRDVKSGLSEWSDELYRILGLERGATPPIFESFCNLVHQEDRAALVENEWALVRDGQWAPREYRIIRPDGGLRVVYIEIEPLLDEAGRPNRLVITFHDVTELRAAEERERDLQRQLLQAQQHEAAQLRESEARLRRSQQHLALAQRVSQTGSVLYDIANETEEWSDELYRINGLERGEQPATFADVLALVAEEDRASLIAVKAALERGTLPPPMQYRLRRPDGERRVIQLDVAPLGDDDGPPSQVVITLRDVTELRAAEERLRRSQQHLALAQRVSQTGSVLHDLKSNVSEWSDELFRILGRERSTTPPTFQSFLEAVHEEDRATLVQSNQALLRGEWRSLREFRIVRPDGALRMIHSEIEPLLNEAGRPSRLIITLHDVTELRAAEGRERDLERQLLHAQKLEALGTLAGGVAHDLNNTLVPVLALAKLTMKRLPEGSREQANLAIILKAGERARDLVRQILAFSRKDVPTRQAVDIAALLRDSLRMLASSLPATLRIDETIGEVPLVSADPGQLHQLLINLVVNAAQAIGDQIGAIAVTLDTGPHPLPDAAGNDALAPAVHLAVEDTGCGMDEATRQRIFEPFFTTKPVGEGTGLGLSVVHGIIAQHGGRITVTSHPGHGTRFDVYLPALSREEETHQLETAALAV